MFKLATILLAALALSPRHARADEFTSCTATITDSFGNVQPLDCPSNWLQSARSSITPSGATLTVSLSNYIWPVATPPAGSFIQYSGISRTSTTGEFVISGGTGTGSLRGNASGDYGAWRLGRGIARASESYYSNLVTPSKPDSWSAPVVFSFAFGVPFTLTLSDEMDFSGSAHYPDYSDLEDITSVYANLTVYDGAGAALPMATISEVLTAPGSAAVVVPEASSATLLLSLTGVLLTMRKRFTYFH